MRIKVAQLSHHPLNREIYSLSSIEELVDSIEDVGLLQNLTIDQHQQVISGNRRLEAIRRIGWKEVEVNQIEVDENDVISLLIHFNKQRVKTIQELLNEHDILEKYYGKHQGKKSSVRTNRGSTRDTIGKELGISSSQLARLLVIRKHNTELIQLIDRGIMTTNQAYLLVRREKKEQEFISSTKKSEIQGEKEWTFYKESSEAMNQVKDETVQTIFTSPPYWNKRNYSEVKGLGNESVSSDYVDNLVNHLKDCKRVLKPTGSFFLNLGDTFNDGNLQNIPHRVIIKLQEEGWILRNTIIWSKTNPKPSSTKTNLTPSYEFIFHLVLNKDYDYYPVRIPLKSTTKASHPPRHRGTNRMTTTGSPYIPNLKGKNMGDYWNEDVVRTAVANQRQLPGVEHPAQFPHQIVTLPILQTSKEKDIILDPFCGTGTVGRVCSLLDRSFIGYDPNVTIL